MAAMTHFVAYLSPTGNTRRVAETIVDALRAGGAVAEILDPVAAAGGDPAAPVREAAGPVCVWVGSPVYAQHPVPPVLRFVERLPVRPGSRAVPFVTWGSVSSGLALWDLGIALAARGYGLLGAASVPAAHCTFWRSDDPLGAGRPNRDDLVPVEALVEAVLEKLAAGGPLVAPEVLDYQPPAARALAEGASLARAKARTPPRTAVEARCNRCGACETACPVGAVTLDPYPVFAAECVLCNECVRACPEDAIPFDAAAATVRIRGLVDKFQEAAVTQVFR